MSEALLVSLARILLPGRAGQGILTMLEFYYDDSGVHGGSDVVVWGGIAGHTKFVNEMQAAWDGLLGCPCDGKPPIKKFSSYDLFHGTGEFEGYNQGERDLTRKNFRDAISSAGLTVLSYGVSVADWDELVTGFGRIALKSPEHMILALAIRSGCDASIIENQPVAFVFDAGATYRADIAKAFRNGVASSKIDSDTVSYGVSPVLGNAGLQAADLVAHETYQLFREFRLSGETNPAAHLNRLRQDAHDFRAEWIGRSQIENMLTKMAEWFTPEGGPR